jgi:hypothetical protein
MSRSTAGGCRLVGRGHKRAGRSRRCSVPSADLGASTTTDLDLVLIAVYCTADDLLPRRPENAKRILTPSSGRPPDPSDQRTNDMRSTRNSLKTNSGPSDWFTGTVYIDPRSPPLRRRLGPAQPASTSPRVPARRGTPIRSVRRSTSPRASAAASARGNRSRRSARATGSSSSPERTTGTAPRPTAS